MASHSDRPHGDRVRAALPPELAARLEQLAPIPRGGRDRLSHAVGAREVVGLEVLNRHLSERPAATRRAYVADWRRWCAWCALNERAPLPAHPDDVALYLASAALPASAADLPVNSASTVVRWSGAIAAAHAAHDLPTPTTRAPASTVLSALRRISSPRTLASRPLTDEEFRRLVNALPPNVWPEVVTRGRDRLILTLGRVTALPPDDLLDLRVNAVRLASDERSMSVEAGRESLRVAIPQCRGHGCAWCAFADWRALVDLADAHGTRALEREFIQRARTPPAPGEGHRAAPRPHPDTDAWLFRRLHRGGSIGAARPVTQTVKRLVQTYAQEAGIATTGLTAFSLRAPSPS